ncbi:hypothetical protein C0J52_23303 [Blattella germanica]|nr:hypothetical protein C0J52_23303 [Blattella germanica]
MAFTVEQRVFINNTSIKCSSWRRYRCRFQRKCILPVNMQFIKLQKKKKKKSAGNGICVEQKT